MKILLKTRGIPSKETPMWGVFEMDQAAALTKSGHNVVAISVDFRSRFQKRRWGISKGIYNGVEFYNLYLPFPYVILPERIKIILKNYLLDIIFRKYILPNGKPDIIHAHYVFGIAESVALARKYSIPLVGTEHWSEINKDQLANNVKYLANIAYTNTDSIIAVSKSLAQRIKQHFSRESFVVHNMVNELFLNTSKLKSNEGKFKFITVGSLLPIKAQSLMIDAFAKAEFDKNVTLSIVGGGPLMLTLKTKVKTLGLQDSVFIVGQKTKPEIINLLAQSDVFLLSSLAENFSVAVLEALSVGLPCVATLCGGTDECINNTNGILVPVNDVDAFSKAIVEVKENYHNYDSDLISKQCKDNYSPSAIAKKLEKVYIETINNYTK